MTQPYKLPLCWLGKQKQRNGEFYTVGADEINPACTCANPLNAFMCPEGHMTECHKGMDCEQADCSHLAQYRESEET